MARFVNPFTDFGFKKLFGEGRDRKFPFDSIRFNRKEQNQYEKSLKYYRDLKNVTDTAFFEGKEEGFGEGVNEGIEIGKEQGIEIGKEQGIEIGKEQDIEIGMELGIDKAKKETAKAFKALGIDRKTIATATGLSEADIEKL